MSKKIKILAVIHITYTNTFDTLYYEASNNKKFDMQFVLIPFKQDGVEIPVRVLEEMMLKKGYPYVLGYDEKTQEYLDPKTLNPDIVFVQSPYDAQRISKLYSISNMRKFAQVYHISYGGTMISYDVPPYDELFQYHKNECAGLTAVLSENKMIVDYLHKFDLGNHVPLGYIKCDKYLHYRNNPYFSFNKRDDYEYIIAWKPKMGRQRRRL